MRIDKDNIKIILILLVVCLGIGYSYLNTELNINGTANINSANWSVYWNNVQVESGSVSAPTPTIDSDKTTVSYTVTLEKPGDYYEFTVDAVNAGTIDAMIDSIDSKLNGVTITTLPDYLSYKVTYEDGINLEQNHLLTANSIETYMLKIKYRDDIEANMLPTSNQTLNLQFTITYKQANENAKEIRSYLYRTNSNNVLTASYLEATDAWCLKDKAYDTCAVGAGANTEEECIAVAQQYQGSAYCEYGQVTPADLGTTYETYQDLVNDTGKPTFVRHKIVNNQIVQSSVGFVYNNNVYYIDSESYYEEKGANYESNRNKLLGIFGNENCSTTGGAFVQGFNNNNSVTVNLLQWNSSVRYTFCDNNQFSATAYADGEVEVESSDWQCYSSFLYSECHRNSYS